MDKASISVELTKALVWPLVALFAMLFFYSDVSTLLKDRELQIGSVKIGQRVNQEFANLAEVNKDVVKNLTEVSKAADLPPGEKAHLQSALNKLASIDTQINKAATNLQAEAVAPLVKPDASNKPPAPKSFTYASGKEDEGFRALAEQNLAAALVAFGKAEENWPGFHNVAEIMSLLKKHPEAAGKDPAVWAGIYQTILDHYSWGMDATQRQKFREFIKKHKAGA